MIRPQYKVIHVNDVAHVANNLVLGLKNLGVDAYLYQPTLGTYKKSKLKRVFLPITRTRESLNLKKIVKSQGIDIVHIHYASFAYMAMVARLPFILHCHGSDVHRDLNRPGLRNLIIKALKEAQIVFCSTPNLLPLIKPYRSDVIFLPNPIDTSLFKPQDLPESNKYQLLSISKLDRAKGVDQIIEIIELIWEIKPDTTVGMFSFGSEANLFHAFLETNQSRLILLPFTKYENMPNLINTFKVVLGQQDKATNALGVSELEAMACEKPVICPFGYSDAYPEPPPILLSNTPKEACLHAFDLFKDHHKLLNIGKKSRSWILDYHSINKVSQKLLDYYIAV